MATRLKRDNETPATESDTACTSSKRPRVEDQALNCFKEWCDRSGFQLSPKVTLSKDGSIAQYGMVAVSDIARGESLFEIPRSYLLMPETSGIAELIKEDPNAVRSESGWVSLLLCLMYEYNNPNSRWRPYLDLVPDFRELEVPILWDEKERKTLLQDTGIDDAVESDLNLINLDFNKIALPFVKKHSDVFLPVCQSVEFYKKMVAFVMAYSFMEPTNPALGSFHEEQVKAPPMMVPVADILNHVADHNAELSYEETCLKMMSIKSIKKGEEVYNTYGMLSNAQLLHMYGFAEPYPYNLYDTVEIPMQLFQEMAAQLEVHKDNGELLRKKWQQMLISNIISEDDEFVLGVNGFLTRDELILCLKILNMSTNDFEHWKRKGDFDVDVNLFSDEGEDKDDDDDDEELLSFKDLSKLDASWRNLLAMTAEKCLARYSSTLIEDIKMLASGKLHDIPARNKFVFHTTHSQKELLEKLIKSCKTE